MVVITLAGLILAANIARILNVSITQRVARLTQAAGKIRKGNLNAFADERGNDELSELAHTLNVMALRIKGLVDHLELKVSQRTAELEESRGRFRDLFEHSSSGVAIYRPVDNGQNFIFEDINKAVETIEQVDRHEIIGKKVTEVFPGIEAFGLLGVFQQVAETGVTIQYPLKFYSDDRLQGWRDNSVYKLPSGEIVAIYDDRTAQKQAELEKNAMERQLHQARKMEAIGVLAGGIAHDFNNILGIILGNAELAINDLPKSDPLAQNLDEIRTASLRARDVIRQLLSFSRKAEPKKEPVSIIPLISESLSLMRASIPANIKIEHHIADDCGAIIADPTQIHQVIINLCTNAAHAMEDNGGILRVCAHRIHINGVELSQRMILIQPDIPVILCSGCSDTINAQKALEIGIRCFVEKPVKLSVLEKRIRQVLDNHHANMNN
jgi:signal transduction histidine kinase/HAMP domain-containing protein